MFIPLHKNLLFSFALFTCCIVWSGGGLFAQLYHVPLDQRVTNSQIVIEGKVISKTSFWDTQHRNIYTSNFIEVYKVFKGNLNAAYVEIITEGGIVGTVMHKVSHSLKLNEEDAGIFTLEASNISVNQSPVKQYQQFIPYAGSQGFIIYDRQIQKAKSPFETYTNIEIEIYQHITNITNISYNIIKKFNAQQFLQMGASGAKANVTITNIAPLDISAGTYTEITITGSGFGTNQGTVYFRDADAGGSGFILCPSSLIQSWADAQIDVYVPNPATSGTIKVRHATSGEDISSQSLIVRYNITNLGSGGTEYTADLIDHNASGGYSWTYNANFYSNSDAVDRFEEALEAWQCETEINWLTNGAATTAIDCQDGGDGVNVVAFDNSCALPAGVLGTAYSYYSGCSSGGAWYWTVSAMDIKFDAGATWNFTAGAPGGGESDFLSVATHELGHGHQQGHYGSSGDVMYYALTVGTTARTLSPTAEVEGGNHIITRNIANETSYAGSTGGSTVANACGSSAMTVQACGSPSTCTNLALDGDETGVDCGGTICITCAERCSNGIQDGDETGVDCGGADCPCTCGQPANDDICSATAVPVDASCSAAQTNTCSTPDYSYGCSTTDNTVWYEFTLTVVNDGAIVTINDISLGGDVQLMLLGGGDCNNPIAYGDDCGAPGVFFFSGLPQTSTYWLSVSTADGDEGSFTVCVEETASSCAGGAPGNDDICSATSLNIESSTPFTNCVTSQTNICATADYSGSCVQVGNLSVWYSFSPSVGNNQVDIAFQNYTFGGDVEMFLFDGSGGCGSPSGISAICSSPASTFSFTGLSDAITYYLLVSTTSDNTGDFDICAVESFDACAGSEPTNDGLINDVCSAITIPVEGTCVDGQTNVCSNPDYYGGCVASGNPSVWFQFDLSPPNDQITITFNDYGFGGDVYLFLMKGSCNNPQGVQTICQDPSIAFSFPGLPSGSTYWLEVTTLPGGWGAFDICANESTGPPPTMTGPEQDCPGAIWVCETEYIQTNSYLGYGDINEVSTSSCLEGGETNSMWYVFTVQQSGTFGFILSTTYDYDFALYDITDIGCEGIPTADPVTANPVRCNWSGTLGSTGCNYTTPPAGSPDFKLPPISYDENGDPIMEGIIDVTAGETYALIIDNWTANDQGYTLTFEGNASIIDNTAPNMWSAQATSCVDTDPTITITMDEGIQCSSINQNDFTLTNTTTSVDFTGAITSMSGVGCTGGAGELTTSILITTDGTLTSGMYEIEMAVDASLADKCGNTIEGGSTIQFEYFQMALDLSADVTEICDAGDPVELTATGLPEYLTDNPPVDMYTLTPGDISNSTGIFDVNPTTTTIYTVSATYGGCTKTDDVTITLIGDIITTIDPVDPEICDGNTTSLTATTTIGGSACVGCTFEWDDPLTQTTATATNLAGSAGGITYTVTVTTSAADGSCLGDNTPSSTVYYASAGAGATCDVLYVSQAGGGDGLTKGNPTDLISALADALCTTTIIKMEADVYDFSDRIVVNSYVTIEGGYINGFTEKSSDISGGAATTVIRRDNTADSDDANGCTAFKVPAGEEDFRFQDLRIELPGSPSVTGHDAGPPQMTNYGIQMGAGCAGYKIVRCYIDAGEGSEP